MHIRRIQDVGALIRDRRKALGWTQAQLASRLGVPRKTITRLENALHASRIDFVFAALNLLGLSMWIDAVESPQPSAATSRPDADIAALVDDMMDEL